MKVYKYNKTNILSSTLFRYLVFGYIAERNVDKFNNSVKVFVELGNRDMETVSMWSSEARDRTFNLTNPKDNSWEHISGLKNLEAASKREVKALSAALEEEINMMDEKSFAYSKLLEKLQNE